MFFGRMQSLDQERPHPASGGNGGLRRMFSPCGTPAIYLKDLPSDHGPC